MSFIIVDDGSVLEKAFSLVSVICLINIEGKACNVKKKILIGIYIAMLLFCGKLAFNYIYNAAAIYCYHQNDDLVSMKPLLVCNWSEPYIAHYNQGNVYYESEHFEDAITSYERALALRPPEEKECAIRINLALAMIGTMDEDYEAPQHVDTSLEILRRARDILLEKDCATESGDGHSETAEQLKEEIEAWMEQLELQSETEPEENKETEEAKEQEEEDDTFEKDVKKALKEKQSKANQERRESLDYYEDINKDINFDSDGYIW